MIVVALKGGLGNQMFQYAAARSLAHRLNVELKLDISYYKSDTFRHYSLSGFNINESFFSNLERRKLLLFNKLGLSKWNIYFEKSIRFNPSYHQFKDNTYLDGYFQSGKYFVDIELLIRNNFSFPIITSEIKNSIEQTNSVSIHIRRGDYLNDPIINDTHGICSINYYDNAINYIKSKVENPVFYFFSDDISWVQNNFKQSATDILVSGNNYSEFEELSLMSKCKHHIIANSSYSWWGAWLNPNPDKIVVAPEFWFKNPQFFKNDIVPKDWIKIHNSMSFC